MSGMLCTYTRSYRPRSEREAKIAAEAENEGRVLISVRKGATAVVLYRYSYDLEVAQQLPLWRFLVRLANQVYFHTFFDERVQGAARSWIGRVEGEDYHTGPFARQPWF